MPVRCPQSLTTASVHCRAPNSLAASRHQACFRQLRSYASARARQVVSIFLPTRHQSTAALYRAGFDCLNRIAASISEASAGYGILFCVSAGSHGSPFEISSIPTMAAYEATVQPDRASRSPRFRN